MDSKKINQLSNWSNLLYLIVMIAIVTDFLNGNIHSFIFAISTVVLVIGIIGIASIELIKLQVKQKQKH